MELDRAARYLEVFMCLAWITVFYLRLRPVHVDSADASMRLRAAVRPIRIGAAGTLGAAVALWLEAGTQPYAHALTISAVLALGISLVVDRLASPSRV